MVNASNPWGYVPLHGAALYGCVAVAQALLERGASPNVAHQLSGYTAVHFAASRGFAEVLRVLMEGKGEVSARTAQGHTALDLLLMIGEGGPAAPDGNTASPRLATGMVAVPSLSTSGPFGVTGGPGFGGRGIDDTPDMPESVNVLRE